MEVTLFSFLIGMFILSRFMDKDGKFVWEKRERKYIIPRK